MAKPKPRFTKSDFSDGFIEKWEPSHIQCGVGFQCSRPEFGSHYKKRVPRDIAKHLGQCWIITHDRKLVGFITLLADKLQISGSKKEQKKLFKKEDVKYASFPAVKIGLLAVDERTKGAGKALIEWAILHTAKEISPKVGVRFMTVDALYDSDDRPHYDISPFYKKLGFMYANPKQRLPPKDGIRTMYFDLKEIIDKLAE